MHRKLVMLLLIIASGGLMMKCSMISSQDDEGTGVTPGIPPPALQSFPRWHPVQDKILYYNHGVVKYDPETKRTLHDPDSTGLWIMNADGDGKHNLLSGQSIYADWSPTGDSIVFERGAQIYKARFNGETIDTAGIEQLTSQGRNFFPDWSPDGEWIAYDNTNCGSANDPPPPNSCGVLIMKTNGSDKKLVASGRMPNWSLNSNDLIYIGLYKEIYRIKLSDESTLRLTSFNQKDIYATDNRYPRYSPDGTKIAFESDAQLWVMDADGSNPKQLNSNGRMPDWSPDGTRTVFIGPEATIWVMNSDGSNPRQLTFRPEGEISEKILTF